VPFLGLVDTAIPGAEACHPYDVGFSGANDGVDVERLVDHRLAGLRHEFEAIGAHDVIDRALSVESAEGPPSFFRRWIELSVKNDLAARRYIPRPYGGRFALFVEGCATELIRQWEPLALGGLDVHHIREGQGPLAMRPELGHRLKSSLDSAAPPSNAY
jgi:hypothetical protein